MRIPMHAPNAAEGPAQPAAGRKPEPVAPVIPKREPFRRHPVCLLLAIAFAGFVGFFPPSEFAHGPQFIGYLIGASAVGLLLPLIVSFLAYMLCGRSSFAANFSFGLLVAFFLSGAIFNSTKSGKEMTNKLRTQVQSQFGVETTAAEPSQGPITDHRPAVKGAPEVRVYRRSATVPEQDRPR